MYVDALWRDNILLVYLYTHTNSFQFLLLACYIVFELDSLAFTIMVHAMAALSLLVEVRELSLKGERYFAQVWNWLDILGNISIFAHCCLVESEGVIVFEVPLTRQNLMIGTFLSGFRASTSLRIFHNYRIFIELLRQTLFDMTTFLSLLFYIIFVFSLLRFIHEADGEDSTLPPDPEVFLTQIHVLYTTMFGENPEVSDLSESHSLSINYLLFTLIVNIVALNLLIAVIQNTFDAVQSSLQAHHLRTKASILLDISTHLTGNRQCSERVYLHFPRPSSVRLGQSLSRESDEFAGRIRVITDKIEEVGQAVKRVEMGFAGSSGVSKSD